MKIFNESSVERKSRWLNKIAICSKNFRDSSIDLERELHTEISQFGIKALLDHLRLSGDIPEAFEHDSTVEKLYSKYTDIIVSEAFKFIGLKSLVLQGRSDVADVEVFGDSFSFVADAKAFRLSRTAKNQKDFKVQTMSRWKHGKPYAMIVCPIYQLPTRSSQIYQQATAYNVCIFTYSHLAVLAAFSDFVGQAQAEKLLFELFQMIPILNPSKDAMNYWFMVNSTMLKFSKHIETLWATEKQATVEAIAIAKQLAQNHLASERERIVKMSHEDAVNELLKLYKIDNRMRNINSVCYSGIWDISL